ncbi:MAG TPA: hypothetical protein VJX92_18885 [Methylomirabilota bacterium]|nr:hypothetical protein [Methylomirabilota bacterium]
MTKRPGIHPKPAVAGLALLLVLLGLPVAASRADDATSRTYNAPTDRVYTVARSVLKSLGWDVDKEDRTVGWIRTDSRRLDGDNFGVYAKGVKHRLRVVITGKEGGRATVTVERRVYKEERILFVDKEQDLKTDDRSVEKQILDEIGRSL